MTLKRAMRSAMLAMTALAGIAVTAEPAEETEETIIMQGIDLQFHKEGPTFGEVRQPTFRVHALRAESSGSAPRQWSLVDADAVIVRGEEKEMLVKATKGFCDLENQVAVLSEGVRATSGSLTIALQDLHWDNETGIARSDAFSEATDGTNRINGSSITIYPEQDHIEMVNGSGTIYMAAADTAADKPAVESTPVKSNRYKYVDVDYDGTVSMNLETGEFGGIRDGVVLTLVAHDPKDNLTIRAREVDFSYTEEGGASPAIIALKGNVQIEHATFSGRSDEVSVNFDSGDVEFRGNADLTGDKFESATADFIKYNLNTKNLVLGPGGEIRRFRLFEDNATTDPAGDPHPPAEPRS